MWPTVGFFKEKIICFVDFIYIEVLTEITYIWYCIFEYFNGSVWNCSQLQIYWIKYFLIYVYIYIYILSP